MQVSEIQVHPLQILLYVLRMVVLVTWSLEMWVFVPSQVPSSGLLCCCLRFTQSIDIED